VQYADYIAKSRKNIFISYNKKLRYFTLAWSYYLMKKIDSNKIDIDLGWQIG